MAKRKSANTKDKEVAGKKPEDVVEAGNMEELDIVDGYCEEVPPEVAPAPLTVSGVADVDAVPKTTEAEAVDGEDLEKLDCYAKGAINPSDVQVNCAAAKTPGLKELTAEDGKAKERQEAAAKKAAEAKELAEASPWHAVEEQSDKETTIEACNIATGYQMPKAVFIRCRVNGEIQGGIELMQELEVKLIEGKWKLR